MQDTKTMLQKYVDVALDWSVSKSKISFFILSSSPDKNNTDLVKDVVKERLWEYYNNDFLYIQDFSKELKQKYNINAHNIKVEQKTDNETYKVLLNNYNYKDIGTREINTRLQHSSAWSSKILFIENIERMWISAINAFLKTCEEPLPNRVIIATTANKSQILDTVISRAIVINAVKNTQNNLNIDLELSDDLNLAIKILASNDNIYKKHQMLIAINKKWLINKFIDELIAYYVSKNNFNYSEKRLNIKKMSISNVNMDNLLFYALLD